MSASEVRALLRRLDRHKDVVRALAEWDRAHPAGGGDKDRR